jgi:hypothetical protein
LLIAKASTKHHFEPPPAACSQIDLEKWQQGKSKSIRAGIYLRALREARLGML